MTDLPMLATTAAIRNGIPMPSIDLGVFEAEDTSKACASALAMGYRHIDTAQLYKNETEVGRAVRVSCIEMLLQVCKIPPEQG